MVQVLRVSAVGFPFRVSDVLANEPAQIALCELAFPSVSSKRMP